MSGIVYIPPSISATGGVQYNESFFTSSSNPISLLYGNTNYLQRVGNPISVASNTTFKGSLSTQNLSPITTNTYSIGNSSDYYNNIYCNTINWPNNTGSIQTPNRYILSTADYYNQNSNLFMNISVPSITTAQNNIGLNALAAISSGNNNTAVGTSSFGGISTGTYNVGLGIFSGLTLGSDLTASYNTCLGSLSGYLVNGNNNLLLGYNSGTSLGTGSNNVCIGHLGQASANNTAWLIPTNITTCNIGTDSSSPLYLNIGNNTQASYIQLGSLYNASSVAINSGSGNVLFTNMADSTSSSSGSAIFEGGLAVAKKIWTGSSITSTPNLVTQQTVNTGNYYIYSTVTTWLPTYLPSGAGVNSSTLYGATIYPSQTSANIRVYFGFQANISSNNNFQYSIYRSINGAAYTSIISATNNISSGLNKLYTIEIIDVPGTTLSCAYNLYIYNSSGQTCTIGSISGSVANTLVCILHQLN